MRACHTSVSRWSSTGTWVTGNLFMSPGLFSLIYPILTVLQFRWSSIVLLTFLFALFQFYPGICLGTYLSFRFLWILRWDLSRYLPSFSLSFIFALWSVWVLTFLSAYFFHFYPVICLGTYLSFRLFFSILPHNLSGYLAFFFLSFNFTLWSVETGTSTIRPVLFFFFVDYHYFWYVCVLKSLRSFSILFFRTHTVCLLPFWDVRPYALLIFCSVVHLLKFFPRPLQEWSRVFYQGNSPLIYPF